MVPPPLRVIVLAAFPKAASLLKAKTPPCPAVFTPVPTIILPTKSFEALFKTNVPAPVLVKATPPGAVPVTCPLKVSPWTTFDAAAVPTLTVVKFLLNVVVPVNSSP